MDGQCLVNWFHHLECFGKATNFFSCNVIGKYLFSVNCGGDDDDNDDDDDEGKHDDVIMEMHVVRRKLEASMSENPICIIKQKIQKRSFVLIISQGLHLKLPLGVRWKSHQMELCRNQHY